MRSNSRSCGVSTVGADASRTSSGASPAPSSRRRRRSPGRRWRARRAAARRRVVGAHARADDPRLHAQLGRPLRRRARRPRDSARGSRRAPPGVAHHARRRRQRRAGRQHAGAAVRADPATTPTTPRVYLSSPAPGTGSAARRRRLRARASAADGRSSPMSTSRTSPGSLGAAPTTSPVFRAPNVTVTSARTARRRPPRCRRPRRRAGRRRRSASRGPLGQRRRGVAQAAASADAERCRR